MTNRQTIQKFLAPAKQSIGSMTSIISLDMIITLQMICLVYFVQYAVAALEGQQHEQFFFWIYMMIGISVLGVITKILWKPLAFKVFTDLRNAIDRLYAGKIIYGNNNKFEGIGTGRLIAVYSKGADTWVDLLANLLSEGFSTTLLFGSFLYTTGTKNVDFFRAILGMLFVIFVRFYYVGGVSYPWRWKAKTVEIERQRMRVRRFMSKYEIMQSNKLEKEIMHATTFNQTRYDTKKIEKFYQGIAYDVPLFFASILFTGLVYFAGQEVISGTLSYSDITGIVGIGAIFIKDLEALLRRIRVMVDKWIDVSRLRELADDLQKDTHDVTKGNTFMPKEGNIQFDTISYGYTPEEQILQDFSFTIQGGKKTALVGPSGGGKTTLIKLVAGYLMPDKGNILVDGQALTDISLLSYYKHVGYLTQEPSVFDGTVRENLAYGMEQSITERESMKSIEHILPLAKCERIYDLPQGLDTEIGERGIRLSGGQKQRLAIAKIMLKNPNIILLDEPTSALDSANEQAVTEALNNLFKNKTVIIIAHRLQTVKHADDIIYIADGQVIERGTHDELLALGGEYYTMVELQSGF